MRFVLLAMIYLTTAGCAVSYTSNLSLEFGNYKLVKADEYEELKQQVEDYEQSRVVSETRVGE